MLPKKPGSYFEHVAAAVLMVVVLASSLSCQRQSHHAGRSPLEYGPRGAGGPDAPKQMIVGKFDTDDDGKLDEAERSLARQYLATNFRPPRLRPRRGGVKQGQPGPIVDLADVKKYSSEELYDPTVLRTIFLEFKNDDWEQELAIFKPSDVEVPANMTVDGVAYANVGVRFRGTSSFHTIPDSLKRSLNISLDYQDKNQDLLGYTSLNLLNGNDDDSLMSSLLYAHIASQKIATPKVNFVQVVINGRNWGVYVNSEQFNKVFLQDNFGTRQGARWKVPGSPHGDGGLRYLGENIDEYRTRYEIKSLDNEQTWQDLIHLCKVLNQTPAAELEAALAPILDIDAALWFLAVDVATSNPDGYWARASDYNIYQATDGKFHILPHDMNEAFQCKTRRGLKVGMGSPDKPPHGRPVPGLGPPPGAQGRGPDDFGPPIGQRPGGIDLDPLIGLDREFVPLRSKLLANPKLRQRYLQHLKTIATDLMNWESVGPRVEQMRELIEEEVLRDSRKLMTNEAFLTATSSEASADASSLRYFSEKRTAFLLGHEELKSLPTDPIEILVVAGTKVAHNPSSEYAALPRGESPIVISEVMANNQSTVADPQGEYDDWIELHNRGEITIDLSSYYLTDNENEPPKWKFPPGSKIAAGSYLLVWADNDMDTAGLHANFKLSSDGETITLVNGEFLLDKLRFAATKADESFGKLAPNGESTGAMMPTPGEKNMQ